MAQRFERSENRAAMTIGYFLKSKRRYEILTKLATHVLLLLGAMTVFLPFFWMVSTSFKGLSEVFLFPPQWFPEQILFTNYQQVLRTFPFFRFFLNSTFVSVTVAFGVIASCALGAYSFARIQFWGRDVLFLLFLGTMMIPGQVTMIPVFIWMRELGWINTYQALIFPQIQAATPFGTFLLRQFFMTLPDSYEEAAILDGANRLQIFWTIFLPLSKPALATLGMFSFMGSWNNLLWPLIMINSQRLMTLPLGLQTLQGQYTVQWNLLMAGTVLAVLPVLLCYFLAQRYFVEGITLSGIKG